MSQNRALRRRLSDKQVKQSLDKLLNKAMIQFLLISRSWYLLVGVCVVVIGWDPSDLAA